MAASNLQQRVTEAITLALTDLVPKSKSNIGKLAAEYAVYKLARDVCERTMDEHAPTLRGAAMFDGEGNAQVYDNATFTLNAKESKPRRKFDRSVALVTLAKRFNLTAKEANNLLDMCYTTGDEPTVSLLVKVK